MTERFLEFLVRVGRAIRDALRSRYVRELETEVARLRAENRALLNSLLGTAGIPPIFDPERQASAEAGRTAPAVRRRSWQQLGRMLEIEEARRLRQLQQQMVEAEPRSSAPEISGRTKTYTERNGAERNAAKPSCPDAGRAPAPYGDVPGPFPTGAGASLSSRTGPAKPNGGA